MIQSVDCKCGVKIRASPRIFQTYRIRFNQPLPKTTFINLCFGPFISFETFLVVILMIEYNHMPGYFHTDGASDGIHERKGDLIATCKVDVGS